MNISKTIIASVMLMTVYGASAGTIPSCPTVDELKSFDANYIETIPVGFDVNTKSMKMTILQTKDISSTDTVVFILSAVKVAAGEDPEVISQGIISNLQLETETPFLFRVTDDLIIPICSYGIPGNDDIKGLVFHAPTELGLLNRKFK